MVSGPVQRYIAEFIGTLFLLIGVTGAALVTLQLPVLGYTGALIISLAIGLVLAVSIYALGEISGGHFNPAVTVAMAIARRLPAREAIPYIVAQVAGGLVGVLVVAGWANGYGHGWNVLVSSGFASQGFSASNSPYSYSLLSVILFEVVATFLFIFIILRVTNPSNGTKNLAPLTIGFTLVMANLIGIGVDGASFNPARSFAPAIVSQIWQPAGGAWALTQSWVFWVAPIVGGILAALVEMTLFSSRRM